MAAKKGSSSSKKSASAKKAASSARKGKSISSAYNKSALFMHIAEGTGLSRKQVASVFDELKGAIEGHVKKSDPLNFVLPGLLKIKVIKKPATKARKGINPFTGEETTFKAKPARKVVKVQALKALKQMAG